MNVLFQLLLILIAVIVAAFVGLVVYETICAILNETRDKLASHNVNVSATGASIGVKQKDRSRVLDSTQRQFVGAWNKSQTLGKVHGQLVAKNETDNVVVGYTGNWLWGGRRGNDVTTTTKPQEGQKKTE